MLVYPFLLPHKMAAQFCGGPELLDAGVSVSFTSFFVMLEYLVPPARSRYCASPEASILTKAKAKLEHPPTEGRQLRTKH